VRFARQDKGIVLMAYPFLSLNIVSMPENEEIVQHSSSVLCLVVRQSSGTGHSLQSDTGYLKYK